MLSSVLLVSLLFSSVTPLATTPLAAVSDTPIAALSGVVTDRFGHPLPGAEVRLTNAVTGEVLRVKSDENGMYRFRSADPTADYTLSVRRLGFTPQALPGMHVGGQDVNTVSFELDSVQVKLSPRKEHKTK